MKGLFRCPLLVCHWPQRLGKIGERRARPVLWRPPTISRLNVLAFHSSVRENFNTTTMSAPGGGQDADELKRLREERKKGKEAEKAAKAAKAAAKKEAQGQQQSKPVESKEGAADAGKKKIRLKKE